MAEPDAGAAEPISKRRDEDDSSQTSRNHWLLLAQHAALLTTLFAFLTVAIKSLSVADGNGTTALIVLRSAGPVQVLLGAIVTSFGVFLNLILVVFVVCSALSGRSANELRDPITTLLVFVLALLMLTLGSWISFLGLGLTWYVATGQKLPKPLEKKRPSETPAWHTFAWLMLPLFLFTFWLDPDVWLPAEVVQLENERIVGYVLGADPDWTTVLRDENRAVVYISSASVQRRRVCEVVKPLPTPTDLVVNLFSEDAPPYTRC